MDPTKDNTKDNTDVNPTSNETTGTPDIPEIPTTDTPVGAVDIDSLTDPKTPDIPEAPVATPPEMPEMPEMDTSEPSTIENNPNITIESTKEPKDELKEPKPLDVKPAEPVPGSIGSAKSGPAEPSAKIPVATGPMTATPTSPAPPMDKGEFDSTMPDSTNEELVMAAANTSPAMADTTPEPTITVQQPSKSRRTTMILIIVLAIVLLGACIAGIVLLMQGSSQSANKNSNQPTITTTSTSELACMMDVTTTKTEALQTPVKAQNTKKFSYTDNSLTEMADTTKYSFESADVAKEKVEALKTSYQDLYTTASLTQDPFESNFDVNDAVVMVTHNANADQINAKNASILGLKSDDSGTVTTDQESIKKTLEEAGYICVASDSTTTTK